MKRSKTPQTPPGSREARQLAAVILDVLAGSRTPQQAADTLSLSLPRYYQLEARALAGLIDACEAAAAWASGGSHHGVDAGQQGGGATQAGTGAVPDPGASDSADSGRQCANS